MLKCALTSYVGAGGRWRSNVIFAYPGPVFNAPGGAMRSSPSDALEKARLAVQQAKARLQAIENRQSEAERKLDTRRKIIMGGLLLDAAAKDERYAKVVSALMARIDRDNDRKAFQDWTPPTPAAAPGPMPPPTPNSSTGAPNQP